MVSKSWIESMPITHRVEGGRTIEEVKSSLIKKLSTISTKEFPCLIKLLDKEVIK